MPTYGLHHFNAPGGDLNRDVPVSFWSPPEPDERQCLPLLVVADGSEFCERGRFIDHIFRLIQDGSISPHRVALVDPVWGERSNWYGASEVYSRELAHSVLPKIIEHAPSNGPIVGIGASLGALSLLHCAQNNPETFDGLFLQSTCFRNDSYGGSPGPGFVEYPQVAAFVTNLHFAPPTRKMLHVTVTASEENNAFGSDAMVRILRKQGHIVQDHTFAGYRHDYDPWTKDMIPLLPDLLNRCRAVSETRAAA
jgi:enterochelin esterase-like enzyme